MMRICALIEIELFSYNYERFEPSQAAEPRFEPSQVQPRELSMSLFSYAII